MIFLDNASTTRVFDEVLSTMSDINSANFYNPSALYGSSLKIKEMMDCSRQTIASGLGAKKDEIFFTSCATESNNWALNCGFKNKKGNIVISAGEHPSVYNTAMYLKGKGFDVRVAGLTFSGVLDMADLEKKLDIDTSLVSIIHCSNETGMINDLSSITKLIRKKSPKALIHADGVQAFCKLKTDVKRMDVDFYTISAHKICGPKGCGALYINKKNRIAPFIYGGGQENGLRSGTENTVGIVGFAEAVKVFAERFDRSGVRKNFDYLMQKLVKEGWIYNGADGDSVGENSGFILSLSYPGIRSEILQHMLSDEDVLVGLGSACSSKSSENRVLAAMGCDKKSIEGNIRLSFSVNTAFGEVVTAAERISKILNILKNKIRL